MSTRLIDLSKVTLNGVGLVADLTQANLSMSITDTITGASTLTMSVSDYSRKLLLSGIFSKRSTVVVDGAGYELVSVSKSGDVLDLTFEDVAVAALRRRKGIRKISAGATTRAGFSRSLIQEEPWIKVSAGTSPATRSSISRGSGDDANEDTWTCISRVMGEIGWRVYAHRGTVFIYPDSVLISKVPYLLDEGSAAVLSIDFDFDTGLRAAQATVHVQADVHDISPGQPIRLRKLGPADGDWLVDTIERQLGSTVVSLSLTRRQPTLPEPQEEAPATDKGQAGFQPSFIEAQPGTYGGSKLNADQLKNAGIIISVGKSMSLADRDIIIGLMTALQESTLRNLDYGDRDSVGLFQQRPSQGWGTAAQIQDPRYAARKFFEALLKVQNRGSLSLAQAAQAVQRSAFPAAYAKWEDEARAILAASESKPVPSANSGAASGKIEQFVQFALSKQGLPYVWGATGPKSFDCSGLVQFCAAKVGIVFGKPARAQFAECQRSGTEMTVSEAIHTRGALLFSISGSGDHVAISLGNGKTMEAMGTAYGCRQGNASGSRFNRAGRIPGLS